MNLTNKLVEKFGEDKLLHFLLGWVIVSIGTPFCYIGIYIGIIVVGILSIIKEYKSDCINTTKNVIASFLGALSSGLYFVLV